MGSAAQNVAWRIRCAYRVIHTKVESCIPYAHFVTHIARCPPRVKTLTGIILISTMNATQNASIATDSTTQENIYDGLQGLGEDGTVSGVLSEANKYLGDDDIKNIMNEKKIKMTLA